MPAVVDPIVVTSARGVRLTLSDGSEVVDGMSSWWAAIHGYRHPILDEAVRSQFGDMAHVMFGGVTHHPAVELAETLVDVAPAGLEHVFLADSGSVSVEVAIKMALQFARGVGRPARRRLLTVRGGYHGDTLGCMSVCDPVNGMHSMFPGVLPEQIFAPVPRPNYAEKFGESHIAEFADDSTHHMVTNHEITVEGDSAVHSCLVHAQHVRPGAARDSRFTIGGRYEDQLVRTPHGWKFKHRELVTLWSEGDSAP